MSLQTGLGASVPGTEIGPRLAWLALAYPLKRARRKNLVSMGSLLGVSESAGSLSSAFVHQALLLRPMHSNYTSTEGASWPHFCGKRVAVALHRCTGNRSARRLSQERFEHVLVDVGGLADFDVPYVLAIAFEKPSRVL
jgi:hypothetical protein